MENKTKTIIITIILTLLVAGFFVYLGMTIYNSGKQAAINKIIETETIPVNYNINNQTEIKWLRIEDVCSILIQQYNSQIQGGLKTSEEEK